MTHGLDVHVDELLQLRLRQLSEVPADPPSVSAHKHAGRDTRTQGTPRHFRIPTGIYFCPGDGTRRDRRRHRHC
jgi:hypothetical protein